MFSAYPKGKARINTNAARILSPKEKEKEMARPQLRRRRVLASPLSTFGIRGGSRLNLIVMSGTVGALLLLLWVQGSFFFSSSVLFWNGGNGHAKVVVRAVSTEALAKLRAGALQALQSTANNNNNNKQQQSICSNFPRRATTTRMWTQHIAAVLEASQHPDDPDFIHQDWTKKLLSEIPPSVLQHSMVTTNTKQPNQERQAVMDRLLRIVQERLLHPDGTAPPLRVAVMGGTFAEGEGCNIASVPVPEGSNMANPEFCAWPYRLEGFLNALVYGNQHHHTVTSSNNTITGDELNAILSGAASFNPPKAHKWIEVVNLSEEGTDTGFMTPLVGNRIYPKSLSPNGPDIIINAYTQQDYETYGEGVTTPVTIREELRAFFNAIRQSPCGAPPLLIHMDDSGRQLDLGDDVVVLRYWEAFQHAMKADHHNPKDLAMAGHMAMTWVLAYNLLELTLQHCATATTNPAASSKTEPQRKFLQGTAVSSSSSSTSETVSADPFVTCDDTHKCPFAFFAGPQGTVSKVLELQRYLNPYTHLNSGWQPKTQMETGWSRRTGLFAVEPNAQVVFRIPNATQPIRYFHLMTLKSGESPWKDGMVQFRLAILPKPHTVGDAVETAFNISAAHDKVGHVTYHFSVDFAGHAAPAGSDMMLSLELVRGSMFQVLGLMLCS